MLKTVASWHRGIFVSEIISCTRDRRLWTVMITTYRGMDCKKKTAFSILLVYTEGGSCRPLVNNLTYVLKIPIDRGYIRNVRSM